MDIEYKIQVDGKTPLMQSNGNQVLLPKLPTQRAKIQEFNPVDDAELGLYKVGELFGHPTAGFRSAFVEAAKRFKIGKSSASKLLGAALIIEPDTFVILEDADGKPLTREDMEIDVRVIVNKNTQGRMPAAKPKWSNWHCRMTLIIDDQVWPGDEAGEKLLEEILDFAGRAYGVGSGRPELRKLSFGKFSVTRIK